MDNNKVFTTIIVISKYIWKFLATPLFEISGNKISIFSLILALVLFYLSMILSKMARRYVNKFLQDTELDSGVRGSIERFTGYAVHITGILIILQTLGINLDSLAAISAVLMVGIGFGLQNITQNFISGLIILIERPIKVGDLVEVDEVSGIVVEIGARSTLINTRDDVAIIVPNSKFISEQVVNESFSGEKRRLKVSVGVAYGSDVEKVRDVLMNVANSHPDILKNPAPKVFFKDFADSSLNFDLTLWVTNIWGYESILSDIRFAIDKAFKENNISIPFPQRDIHIISQPGKH